MTNQAPKFSIDRFTKLDSTIVSEASSLEIQPGEFHPRIIVVHSDGSETSFWLDSIVENNDGEVMKWEYGIKWEYGTRQHPGLITKLSIFND